jgi:hypothetical protein
MGFPKQGVNVTNIVFSLNNVVWSMGISLSLQSNDRFIYRSTDGGNNFSQVISDTAEVSLPNQPVMASHPTDQNVLFFVTGNRELVKYDYQTKEIKIHPVFPYRFSCIAFSSYNPSIIYLGLEN